MAEKHSISISEKLYEEIRDYCQMNDLRINLFVEELIRKAFSIEKFGETPFTRLPQETHRESLPKDEYANQIDAVKNLNKQISEEVKKEEMVEVIDAQPVEDKPKTPEKPPKRKITKLN